MKVDLSKWGNSAAIRIPKQILTQLNLSIGDSLNLTANEDGCIYLAPFKSEHRKVAPAKGVSGRELFANFQSCKQTQAWPDDNMLGHEQEAWQ